MTNTIAQDTARYISPAWGICEYGLVLTIPPDDPESTPRCIEPAAESMTIRGAGDGLPDPLFTQMCRVHADALHALAKAQEAAR